MVKTIKIISVLSPVILGPLVIFARMSSPTLAALTRSADAIFLVRVDAISTDSSTSALASAHVLDVWKGALVQTVSYKASPGFACDMSSATIGKSAVIFLKGNSQQGVMSIAYAGRGQMLINDVEGKAYVSLTGVLLPKELEPFDKLDPRQLGMSKISIDVLKIYIVGFLEGRDHPPLKSLKPTHH